MCDADTSGLSMSADEIQDIADECGEKDQVVADIDSARENIVKVENMVRADGDVPMYLMPLQSTGPLQPTVMPSLEEVQTDQGSVNTALLKLNDLKNLVEAVKDDLGSANTVAAELRPIMIVTTSTTTTTIRRSSSTILIALQTTSLR